MEKNQIQEEVISENDTDITTDITIEDSLEELHKTRKDRFILAAYSILKNYEEAEDSVQEAFFLAYSNLHTFQGKSSLSTWVYRILINYCFKMNQNRKKEIQHIEASDGKIFRLSDSRQNQVYQLEKNEINSVISKCFDELDMKYSLPLILYNFVGFGIESIAYILDIPLGTVKSRMHLARRKMGFLLKKTYGEKEVLEDLLGLL